MHFYSHKKILWKFVCKEHEIFTICKQIGYTLNRCGNCICDYTPACASASEINRRSFGSVVKMALLAKNICKTFSQVI